MCKRGIYESLCGAGSFLDWIIQVSAGEETPFVWNIVNIEDLIQQKVVQELEKRYDYEALRNQTEQIPEMLQEKTLQN